MSKNPLYLYMSNVIRWQWTPSLWRQTKQSSSFLHQWSHMRALMQMCPDWRGKLAPPLHWLYRWRGQCVHHMWQGWSIGLRPAPLLVPLLPIAHNQPGDEVLAHQASAEVAPQEKPLSPTWGRESGAAGVSWAERKSRGTSRWINIFNRGRDQVFIEWGQREAFSHTCRVWEKTEMSVSWICFLCHGKAAIGQVITTAPRSQVFFFLLTNAETMWTNTSGGKCRAQL